MVDSVEFFILYNVCRRKVMLRRWLSFLTLLTTHKQSFTCVHITYIYRTIYVDGRIHSTDTYTHPHKCIQERSLNTDRNFKLKIYTTTIINTYRKRCKAKARDRLFGDNLSCFWSLTTKNAIPLFDFCVCVLFTFVSFCHLLSSSFHFFLTRFFPHLLELFACFISSIFFFYFFSLSR